MVVVLLIVAVGVKASLTAMAEEVITLTADSDKCFMMTSKNNSNIMLILDYGAVY